MKRYISIIVFLFVTLAMFAMPAKRRTFTYTQSDGTTLTLMLVGDEHLHYYLNVANNDKMLRGDNGDYYVVSDSELETLETKANTRRQAANAARIKRLNARRLNSNGAKRIGTTSGSMTGSKKGLVILVNFSDKTMASAHTQSAFDDQFNKEGYSEGGHLGSVHDFFYDQSYGNFDLTFDVVGPVTVSNKMSYYGSNDSSGNDKYPATMVIEACKLADAAGTNFADYDWDGDGEVDQVYVIYAGYGEAYGASSSTIWPHEWQLSSAKQYSDGSGALTLDGVTIDTYACSCELSGTSGSTLNGIGTACHEFSHCLGYPDFYDTSYAGGFGMNSWDLMDAGSYNGPDGCGEVPAGFTSYERMCAGWLTPTELSTATTITGMKPLGDSPEAYIIYNDKNEDEYILLENRQNNKWFKYVDTYTTPHGLLAIHVDYDETAWNNDEPNNTASHQRMSIIPASGTYGTKTTSSGSTYYTCSETQFKGHPFSGSGSKTSLTGSSNSSSGGKWFTACSTGSTTLNHEVTEITNADDGTISFLFDGGAAEDDGSRYTVTFNAGTGTCGTASWAQTDFQESTTLPTATSPNSDWTFIGWSTTEYGEETSTKPTTLYAAGSSYQPTSDATLYAIYEKTEAGVSESGTYTLDYSAESSLQSTTLGYGNAVSYTATDGSAWIIKAYKNTGLQINKGKNASIKVPDCPGNISTIEITDATARVLSFSSTDYTGSNSPTAVASSESSKSATIDLSSANLTTGYIYTTDGSTVITKIVVNYDAGSSATYYTYPGSNELIIPSLTFAETGEKSMLVGDTYTNIATCSNSTGAITYKSSNTNVVTVNANSGEVKAVGTGSATITATIAAVDKVSKSGTATYNITVTMPTLTGIEVKTQPTKAAYNEGESLDNSGLVLTATYENGYTKDITSGYTTNPADGSVLNTSINTVEVNYTEGDVTKTTSYSITVNELPKYDVTFVINGKSTTITQDVANTGITVPTVNDITTTVDNEEVTYTFSGWTTTDVTEETTTKPTLLTLKDGKYTPTEATTLYAVYTRSDGAYVQGFTLNLTYNGTTYYVGAANSSSKRFDSSNTSGLTLYYSDGYLWYLNSSGKATYVYSSSKSKSDLTHTTTKSNVTNTWTMNETDDIVTFYCSTTSRFLGLNSSTTSNIKCYSSTYPHEWNKTYTDDKYATGTTSYYTSHPTSDETPTIVTVAKLIDELKSGNTSKTVDDIDKMVDEILGR